ncbi:MAG: hypothetical protein AAF514_01310 [Verrucomicrobiota bacterium]
MIRNGFFGLFLLAILSGEVPARDLIVEQARWGFNGKIRNGAFGFLSVEVMNPTDEPFEGSVSLNPDGFGLGDNRSRLRQTIYLAPEVKRLLQFYPYIQDLRDWSLRWGKKGYHRLPKTKFGAPAAIRLSDAGGLGPGGFPYQHFPPTALVGELARTVSIDFTPRWDPARRQAFEDWVRLGGTVRLFREGGVYPNLGPRFAEAPGIKQKRLDRGLVVFEEGGTVTGHLAGSEDPSDKAFNSGYANAADRFSRAFDRAIRPDIPWDVLGLIAIVYVLLVGPGHYFWARKLRRYSFGLAAFFGGVLLFSALFAYVGRRGYGETTTITSLAHARLVSGKADVQSWNNAFVTKGDDYQFSHQAPFNLYSPADQFNQRSRASVRNGKDGRFEAEIPIYSAQRFVHEGLFPFDGSITVEGLGQNRMRVVLPSSFGKVEAVWLRQDKKLYNMGREGNHYEISRVLSVVDPTAMKNDSNNFLGGYGYFGRGSTREARMEQFFKQIQKALLVQANPSWGGAPARRSDAASPAATLFVYAETPDSFKISSETFPQQNGRVLFEIPIYEDAP